MQLKRLAAQDPGCACTARLGWQDMLAELKCGLRDLKTADNLGDRHLKMSSVYEATCILERAASLAPHRLPVCCCINCVTEMRVPVSLFSAEMGSIVWLVE